MRNKGFIQLSLLGYAVLGLASLVLILSIALKVQTARLDSVKAEYQVFKDGVRLKGEEQERRTKETIARQEKTSNERIKSLESRLARTRADFDRLRNSTDSRPVPAVPETARPVDDAARDSRLLEVLRYAQEQTDALIELQEWVRQQQ